MQDTDLSSVMFVESLFVLFYGALLYCSNQKQTQDVEIVMVEEESEDEFEQGN